MRLFPPTMLAVCTACLLTLTAAQAAPPQHWATSWATADQGPYPVGSPTAQPKMDFALPTPSAQDQSFRMILRPSVWGRQVRLRFSNALGTQPVTLDGVYVGVQSSAAALLAGSNRPVRFGGKPGLTLAPGALVWSDPVTLAISNPDDPLLTGRNLAVSFHVAGNSGPMTWHAKALTTSYVTAPGAGARGAAEDEGAFAYSTASWFFLDALDVMAPADTKVVVAMGDSITDGSASTINGYDRWPDALERRLQAARPNRVAMVNTAIAGGQILGPTEYTPEHAYQGGQALTQRLERDVLSLSGVTSVIWLEGINDFSKNGNASLEAVEAGMRDIVGQIRHRFPHVRVMGATLTSTIGTSITWHGFPEQDAKRKALNDFIRTSGLFDASADFDAATLDSTTGRMHAEFIPESSTGGPGDGVHPNRAGYLTMSRAVDLQALIGR